MPDVVQVAWKRILGALVALVVVAALAPAAAQACSCIPRTQDSVRNWLREGDPALIGTIVAAQEVNAPEPVDPPDPSRPSPPVLDRTYAYTVQVERAFNVELGAETTIIAGSNGAMCGIGYRVGQRFGAFLGRRADGAWGTGSCSQVAPDELIAAAQPPVEPPPPPPPVPPTPPTPPTPPVDTTPRTPAPRPAPTLQARFDGRVAAGGPRAGSVLQRLPAVGGKRVRLQFDASARRVRFALARTDGTRTGPLRTATAVARSRREAWSARLPRTLPKRADRLLVFVDYGRGGPRATFAIGLGQPITASVAAAPGLPCPFVAI